MKVYLPGLLERLMGEREQLKDSVARDLEALFNTRSAEPPARWQDWPLARASVLNYGLADRAGADLAGSEERAVLCASLKEAIERHEPRLSDVSAVLEPDAGAVDRLRFAIHATLAAPDGAEPVDFDAVLQPSSLHYAVRRAARPPRA